MPKTLADWITLFLLLIFGVFPVMFMAVFIVLYALGAQGVIGTIFLFGLSALILGAYLYLAGEKT